MMLSPHFSLRELMRSQTATRRGLDNSPGETTITKLRGLCQNVLEPVRAQFGPFSPSSGYRCAKLNALIGGSPNSRHVLGEAADFEVLGIDNLYVAWWVRDHVDFDQVILEFHELGDPNSGWVHCSYVGMGKNRKDVLTFVKDREYQVGLPSRFDGLTGFI